MRKTIRELTDKLERVDSHLRNLSRRTLKNNRWKFEDILPPPLPDDVLETRINKLEWRIREVELQNTLLFDALDLELQEQPPKVLVKKEQLESKKSE